MDSREYIFIYPINSAADIPEDLRACVKDRSFDRGVFLPQDDTNWFTRPPRYPARLLLLDGRWLHIIPHPNSGQCITELHLEDLVQLEAGTILLLGWIDLTTRISTEHLIYNTRGSRPLESLLATARRRWLGEPSETDSVEPRSFGHQLALISQIYCTTHWTPMKPSCRNALLRRFGINATLFCSGETDGDRAT